jgi:predicted nuclease with TOPRIM domain
MDDAAGTQARERLIRWMDESREVLSLLAVLLESTHRATSRLQHSEHETEVLRKELHELRKEISELRDVSGERAKAQGGIEQQLAELQKQNELETVQSTNQIAQKLGVTKSPFARTQQPPAAAPAAAAAPAPAAPAQAE